MLLSAADGTVKVRSMEGRERSRRSGVREGRYWRWRWEGGNSIGGMTGVEREGLER